MKKVLVYSENIGPRLRYAADFILKTLLGMEPVYSSDLQQALSWKGPVIDYSGGSVKGSFQILPSGLLDEKDIRLFVPETMASPKDIFIFPSEEGDLHFDIFSASFYLLSRYEEYLPFHADIHNRFPATESIAFRHGFLGIPVVNRWANRLAGELKNTFPGIKMSEKRAIFLPTIDIDTAWAVRNRGFYRTAGGLVRQLVKGKLKNAATRVAILGGKEKDPFDSFDYIRTIHGDDLTVFMLAGPGGKYDLNNPVSNPHWKELVAEMSNRFTVGFHPSYHSGGKPGMLRKERETLEEITGKKLTRVRQHFLRLTFPGTYRRMAEEGFSEDYSMGYADQAGFRAGTSTPFPFFDLVRNEVTDLKVFPFACMDRTLKDYLELSPEEAVLKVKGLADTVRKEGGCFIPIWHNDSLAGWGEWKGWVVVYQEMLNYIRETF